MKWALILLCASLTILQVAKLTSGKLLGAPTAEKPGDEKSQAVADAVKPEVLSRVEEETDGNATISDYTVVSYKTQVVAGINYFLKVRINDDENRGYVFARVFESLEGVDQLVGLETGHSASDPLTNISSFY